MLDDAWGYLDFGPTQEVLATLRTLGACLKNHCKSKGWPPHRITSKPTRASTFKLHLGCLGCNFLVVSTAFPFLKTFPTTSRGEASRIPGSGMLEQLWCWSWASWRPRLPRTWWRMARRSWMPRSHKYPPPQPIAWYVSLRDACKETGGNGVLGLDVAGAMILGWNCETVMYFCQVHCNLVLI